MTLEELEALPKYTQLKKADGEIVCFIGMNKAKSRVAVCCQDNDVIQSCVVFDALSWTLHVDEKDLLEKEKQALVQENQSIKSELGELLTIEATANLLLEENARLEEENTSLKTELIKLGAQDGAVL